MSLQDPRAALNPFVSLGKQIGEAYATFRDDALLLNATGVKREVARIWRALGLDGDPYTIHQIQLSGGETVRAMLAIVLATKAKLVLLDEPTANLDPISEHYVLRAIEENLADCTKILVTHKVTPIRRLKPSREFVMLDGGLAELNMLDHIQTARDLQKADDAGQGLQKADDAASKLQGSEAWVLEYVFQRKSLYGYSLLSVYDIIDWTRFGSKLIRERSDKLPNPGGRIWELLTPEAQQLVDQAAKGNDLDAGQKSEVVKALNRILTRCDFYQEAAFRNVVVPNEVKRLLDLSRLTVDDIVDWQAFFLALNTEPREREASLASRIWELLPPAVRQTVEDAAAGAGLNHGRRAEAVKALNKILQRRDFYQKECLSRIAVPTEVEELLSLDPKDLSDAQVRRLNRLLLDAFFAAVSTKGRILRRAISDTEVQRLNRLLLVACYPDEIAETLSDDPETSRTSDGKTEKGPLLLRVNNLCVTYGTKAAVREVTFDLYAGEHLGIIGMSGSGKTTLIKCIMGEEKGQAGDEITYYLDGQQKGISLRELQASPKLRNKIQMVTQQPDRSLHPAQTIRQTIMASFDLYRKLNRVSFRGDRDNALRKILAQVGLADQKVAEQFPWSLSGGQKRRAELANVLAALGFEGTSRKEGDSPESHPLPPRIMALDEVTEGLDLALQAEIFGKLRVMQKLLNLTFLAVSHDFRAIRRLCKRCIVLFEGLIVEEFALGRGDGPVLPYTQVLTTPTHIPPHMHPQDFKTKDPDACPMLDICRCYPEFQPDERCQALPEQLSPVPGKPEHRARCWRYSQ